ncbi:arginase family protein [Hymenobacter jejuensis]|uniref:Formimidoylglutamase n=1 Tax=Hymenobacter jejuensis TaxID=2502781 RepID=A0A5B7ZVH5_9BACT|nr:formimidoylglutamase [Hymenobacter jejuensis]QDA58847.1 formimidoylglutamase [Hymenobacter jejuensis]
MPTFIRDLIKPAAELPQADVAFVGLPLDAGTVLEGGRAGATEAPDAIRSELRRYHKTYNLEYDVDLQRLRLADAGNLDLTSPEHTENHERIRQQVSALLFQYPKVVVFGGSHDGTYSTVRGLCDMAEQPGGGLNIDAHADVKNKPEISSGTPFGKLLREGFVLGKHFTEIGLHSNLNAKEDIDFLRKQNAKIITLADVFENGIEGYVEHALNRAVAAGGPVFVSLDLDSLAQAFAPGVSAPSSDGLTPRHAVQAAFLAGRHPAVRLFEVVELNPRYDRDNQTARLAATIVTAYLTGVAVALAKLPPLEHHHNRLAHG